MKLQDTGQVPDYAGGIVGITSFRISMVNYPLNTMTRKPMLSSMSLNKNSVTMSVKSVNGSAGRL